MFLTFASLLVVSWSGHVAVQTGARRFKFRINPFLSTGAGFFFSTACIIVWLDNTPFSISTASWALVGIAAFVLAFSAIRRPADSIYQPSARLSLRPTKATGLVVVVLFCLGLAALMQGSSEVIAWDAFTTWMYRAKLWVLADHVVNFEATVQWLSSGARGHVVEAAHYPISVSALAAFASAIAGEWQLVSAGMPWLFAAIASGAIMFGLCRQLAPDNFLAPTIGAFLLMTTPLLQVHSMLPGYADLWVQGTSGLGLAGICVWSQKRDPGVLLAALSLLAVGTLFKNEGWLWLTIGLIGLVILIAPIKLRLLTLILLISLVALFPFVEYIDLGPLGTWGVKDNRVTAGHLGAIDLRPIDSIKHIVGETIRRGSFLLLYPLYVLVIIWSLLSAQVKFVGYWLMGLLAFSSLAFIFTATNYSVYTELGTALSRVLLHVTPVMVISIIAIGLDILKPGSPLSTSKTDHGRNKLTAYVGPSIAILSISISVFALPHILPKLDPSGLLDPAPKETRYPASVLESMNGKLAKTQLGYQFTDHSLALGVARIEIDPAAVQPRYTLLDTHSNHPSNLSFYWINNLSQRVHSIPVGTSGKTIIDMSVYEDFWRLPVEEIGVMLPGGQFTSVVINSVEQSNTLSGAHTALLNLWATPGRLSQSTINGVDAHMPAPININTVLVFALFLLLGLLSLLRLVRYAKRASTPSTLLMGIATLWIVGSVFHARQAVSFLNETASPAQSATQSQLSRLDQDLVAIADAVKSEIARASSRSGSEKEQSSLPFPRNPAVLVFGERPDEKFMAHKLPYFLLPTPAAKIELSQLNLLPPKSMVLLVLLGSEQNLPVALQEHALLKFQPANIKVAHLRNAKLWWVQRT